MLLLRKLPARPPRTQRPGMRVSDDAFLMMFIVMAQMNAQTIGQTMKQLRDTKSDVWNTKGSFYTISTVKLVLILSSIKASVRNCRWRYVRDLCRAIIVWPTNDSWDASLHTWALSGAMNMASDMQKIYGTDCLLPCKLWRWLSMWLPMVLSFTLLGKLLHDYFDFLGRPDAMARVAESFDRLDDIIRNFGWTLHQDALYLSKVKQWRSISFVGSDSLHISES